MRSAKAMNAAKKHKKHPPSALHPLDGEARAVDIIRLDLMDIAELEDLPEMKRRLTSLACTANAHLNEGTLRMLADVNRSGT